MKGLRHNYGMVRCIQPFNYEGEGFNAGATHTLVHWAEPVVAAHPDRFEPANENDQETRAYHAHLLLRAGVPSCSSGLEAVATGGRSSWQI